VAGTTKEIYTFDAVTGQPGGKLALPDALLTVPGYSTAGGVMRVAAITGNLTQQWTLSLAVSVEVAEVPSLAVEPLTAMPGLPVPRPPR